MRAWTLIELFRLTRAELFGLHQEIVNALAAMPLTSAGASHRSRQLAKHPQGAGAAEPRSPLDGERFRRARSARYAGAIGGASQRAPVRYEADGSSAFIVPCAAIGVAGVAERAGRVAVAIGG